MKNGNTAMRVVWGMGVALLWSCGAETKTTVEATLSGANEVPPVATTATGTLSSTLTGSKLEVNGTFNGLSSDLHLVGGSPGHVHVAPSGENGPILVNLEVTSEDRRSGSFALAIDLDDAGQTAFIEGRLYVNLHTVLHPEGEIRAQLSRTQPARLTFQNTLSGQTEVPPVTTPATGNVTVELSGNVLVVSGSFENLLFDLFDVSGSAAHVHQAPVGQAGPIIFSLTVVPDASLRAGTFSGTATLTADQLA